HRRRDPPIDREGTPAPGGAPRPVRPRRSGPRRPRLHGRPRVPPEAVRSPDAERGHPPRLSAEHLVRRSPEMNARPKVLCVDDEPHVLDGLSLSLRKRFVVVGETTGMSALEWLRENEDVAVVISDMRMPRMDGAEFLARARELRPDAVRVLLTGRADLDAAAAAA